jgi:hypothetical protein
LRNCCRLIILILLCCLPVSIGMAQSTAAAQMVMQGTPAVTSQQIEVRFSVSDQQGFSPAELPVSSIKLSEASANLKLTNKAELPLTLALIVNLSNGSDIDLIKDTLHAYFNGYYQPKDKITFYVLGPEVNHAQVTTPADLATIMEVIDSLKRSPNVYGISDTLKAALTALQAADPAAPRQALYIGSFLNDPQEVNASSIFAGQHIPFNVALVQRYRPQAIAEHRALATYGGGLFANNEAGSGVSLSPSLIAVNSLKVLFDAIASSRIVFTLDYQSNNQNLDKDRSVNLTVTLPDGSQASQSFSYKPQFQPPDVKIISPAPAPVRMPNYSGDRVVFDTAEQFITVAVTFPDGVRRGLKSLQLVATDTTTGRSRAPRVIKAPPPDGSGNYSIPWTFDDFTTPGPVATIELVVTAVDALDLSASAKQDAKLTVAALPPAPEPTAVIVPTTAVISSNSALAGGSIANNLMLSVLAAFVLALILVVVFLILMLIRASRRQANYARMAEVAAQYPVAPAPAAAFAPAPVAALTPEPEAAEEEKLLGRLVTISGLDINEIHINTPEFTIGRDPSCQYVIDQPFISPRHCMIMLRKNTFFIRDLGAKNGTFVNGERLPKNRDIPVPIGSEVNITMNISMELWDAKTVVKLTDRRTSATHHSTVTKTASEHDDLVLKSVFGIKFSGDDEGNVGDDYSPI